MSFSLQKNPKSRNAQARFSQNTLKKRPKCLPKMPFFENYFLGVNGEVFFSEILPKIIVSHRPSQIFLKTTKFFAENNFPELRVRYFSRISKKIYEKIPKSLNVQARFFSKYAQKRPILPKNAEFLWNFFSRS